MKRLTHIILSGIIILCFMGYGFIKKNDIYNIPFTKTDPFICSNGSKILKTGPDFFNIYWKGRTVKTIYLNTKPPFRQNDIVAFKLKKDTTVYKIEEYHIWESTTRWYAKALSSAIPLFIVICYLLKTFQFRLKKFMFIKRGEENA